MINKTNHPNFKNPSFSEDSKTFQSLILDKGFREKVAKKIIEWIVNNPEINADDFDCLIIYWNRFNNELVTVKKIAFTTVILLTMIFYLILQLFQ